jgi:predicted RNase H-like nuclease (RuvC/YqgF family)
MVDELVNPESKETTQTSSDAHEKEIERLKKEMEKMKKHCKEKLAEKDKLTEQQKTVIETTLDELEASKGNAQELQNKVDNLTVRLSEFTTRPITATTDQGTQTDEPTINTLTIKYVPTNGKLRFGVNN